MHNWIHLFEFGICLCNKYSTVNYFNKSGWGAGVGGRCSGCHPWPGLPVGEWQAHSWAPRAGAGFGPFPAGGRMAPVGGRAQGHGGRRTGET